MKALAPAARRFLFAPADAWSAALFRVGLAAMLAVVFHPAGTRPYASLLAVLPEVERLYAIALAPAYWWAILGLLALFGTGLRPRLAAAVLLPLLAPLVPAYGRLPGRLVLWSTLLAFSFESSDAALSPAQGRRRSAAGPLWPVRLVQLQLAALYGVNALAKSTPEYLSGDVLVAQSAMLENVRVDLTDGTLSLGPLAIPAWLAAAATVLTEYALALGFWSRRTRVPAAILGVTFHAGLTRIVRIGYLDLVSVFLYAAFLLPFDRGGGASGAPGCGGPGDAGGGGALLPQGRCGAGSGKERSMRDSSSAASCPVSRRSSSVRWSRSRSVVRNRS